MARGRARCSAAFAHERRVEPDADVEKPGVGLKPWNPRGGTDAVEGVQHVVRVDDRGRRELVSGPTVNRVAGTRQQTARASLVRGMRGTTRTGSRHPTVRRTSVLQQGHRPCRSKVPAPQSSRRSTVSLESVPTTQLRPTTEDSRVRRSGRARFMQDGQSDVRRTSTSPGGTHEAASDGDARRGSTVTALVPDAKYRMRPAQLTQGSRAIGGPPSRGYGDRQPSNLAAWRAVQAAGAGEIVSIFVDDVDNPPAGCADTTLRQQF